MRVLLDENVPVDLAGLLGDHDVETVSDLGWIGVKNSELLRRMHGSFRALVTMDRKLPHQQNLAIQPFGVVLLQAPSNRMIHLQPLVPDIVAALDDIAPGELRRVGA
jgi:predicted nuclease of predicted toxin-antitoxin system